MTIYHLYLGFLLAVMIGNIFWGGYVWRNRHIPSAKTVLWGIGAVILVNLMFFILTVTPSEEVAYVTARVRFLGLDVLNVVYIVWAAQYTHLGAWVTPLRVAALCIIPITTQVVLWLTPFHTSFFREWALIRTPEGFNVEHRVLGGFHDVNAVYTLVAMGICVGLLLRYSTQVDAQKRVGLSWFVGGALLTSAITILPLTLGESPGLRLLPISMGLVTATMAWVLIRFNVYSILPLAYDLVYNSMSDAVLVLDNRRHLIRANPATEQALGLPRRELLKRSFAKIMPQADDPSLFRDEVVRFEVGGAGRSIYLGKCQPISIEGHRVGWLIVLHDVTAQRRAEADLSASERRVTALAQAVAKATADDEREQHLIVAEFARMMILPFRATIQQLDNDVQIFENNTDPDLHGAYLAQINADADALSSKITDMLKIITRPVPDTSQHTD